MLVGGLSRSRAKMTDTALTGIELLDSKRVAKGLVTFKRA